MKLVEHGPGVDALAREARWIKDFGEIAAPIAAGRADRAREGAGRAAVEGAVAHDGESRHHRAHLGIAPAIIVERVESEIAVDEGDRSEEVEAVIGGFARLRIDPT